MDLHISDWLNLLVRWVHLIAGIYWIGSSFYFMWLDSHLTLPDPSKKDVEGELWMVHSGGFYQVERRKIGPGTMPKVLHWFKYEALFTWISGFFMLGIVYYSTHGAYLVDAAVLPMNSGVASAIGVGSLLVSWFVYDTLWQSPLGRNHGRLTTAISLLLAGAAAYALCHLFSGRAAFVHFGAILGTLMVANVWVRILPAQQKMVDATKEGRTPDFTLSGQAKRRSVHNTYMTFPVLFMMLSTHYPNNYSHPLNWVVLLLLFILGAALRHVMVAKNGSGKWAYAPAAVALLALIGMTASTPAPVAETPMNSEPKVSFREARNVIQHRCVACHSAHPTITTFGPMPGGVQFETVDRIQALVPRIRFRAVETKTMPLANQTGITEEERTLLGRWIDQGASIAE